MWSRVERWCGSGNLTKINKYPSNPMFIHPILKVKGSSSRNRDDLLSISWGKYVDYIIISRRMVSIHIELQGSRQDSLKYFGLLIEVICSFPSFFIFPTHSAIV